jgi:hypothetical protein
MELGLDPHGRAELSWVYFFAAIVFGVFLYWLRCRHRVLYGVAEILVALGLIYLFFFPQVFFLTGGGGGLGSPGQYLSRTVALFGGLYALVRGLDNIDAREKWTRARQWFN